jgi:hypothetical protein
MRQMISVPICDECGKPHYGRRKVSDRCLCDFSGRWHEGEIEEEPEEKPNEQPKENE